ncbi:MAG: valine--pyruvate transaminase [Oceanicoccus sp.]|uniref:valine--pyruvate transaminase n=1 Tax=Oceanicoccus sp. TaxID=2691044 RepID=UPI002619841E|nr:valine--pyruvate transaminase [Oceanicoccus sp.]MCP3906838.1 valine--pyruvate transaminase [Oceanicoccus sp.]MDG1772058.1 valine--pyruvate transaminase [Oceanicoccus sp.]
MKLSAFGKKFSGESGIVELMDDLGSALNENPDMIFMGGGNPGRLVEVEEAFQKRLQSIIANPSQRHSLFGIYQSPQGEREFRDQVAQFLTKQFGWKLTGNNIAVSNGSQSAFFVLFNMFAGPMPDGSHRSIHLPLAPEYIGYADIGLSDNFFTATRPSIQLLEDNLFKYRVDFSQLQLDQQAAALCVSRPTNPTGNVLTDNEIAHLDEIAQAHNIPFIIDGAYGLPFPGILFNQAKPHWNENTILALSLSKLGLPGVRTGIIVASEEVIQAYTNANTIVSLACGNLGPALAMEMFKTGEILSLTRDHVTPFYRDRSRQTVQWFREQLGDLPFHIHKPEGAIFLWLWFEGLPITSQELYERLKKRGVLIVPGQNFFVGIEDDWSHQHECIRVSYAQDAATVKRGVEIIAEEVARVYA